MSLMPWPTIRIAVLRVRPTSARVLPAIAIVSLLLLANDVAARAEEPITDPDAPIVTCAALICTHPFGLYDYYYFLPGIESAATP